MQLWVLSWVTQAVTTEQHQGLAHWSFILLTVNSTYTKSNKQTRGKHFKQLLWRRFLGNMVRQCFPDLLKGCPPCRLSKTTIRNCCCSRSTASNGTCVLYVRVYQNSRHSTLPLIYSSIIVVVSIGTIIIWSLLEKQHQGYKADDKQKHSH